MDENVCTVVTVISTLIKFSHVMSRSLMANKFGFASLQIFSIHLGVTRSFDNRDRCMI
jgi:hypothetical protein